MIPCPLYCWRILCHLVRALDDPVCNDGPNAWEIMHYWYSKNPIKQPAIEV